MSVEVVCLNCGTTVVRSPSAARSETTFCTRRCRAQFQARERMNQTAEQFWSRVAIGEPNACWEWTGYRSPAGYGQTAWKGKVWLAHRVALSLVDNDWGNKLPVCHSCDLPPCCNPTHLWRGTHRQNQHDKLAKGRARYNPLRGEQSPHAKLTKTDIVVIRSSRNSGTELAKAYGVAETTISSIRNSRSWSHIP